MRHQEITNTKREACYISKPPSWQFTGYIYKQYLIEIPLISDKGCIIQNIKISSCAL